MITTKHDVAYVVFFSGRPNDVMYVTSASMARIQASAMMIAAEECGMAGLVIVRPVKLTIETDESYLAKERAKLAELGIQAGN